MPFNANQILDNLFQNVGTKNTPITKGSIIRFHYRSWKHDPYPVVIVTDVNMTPFVVNGRTVQPRIRGVNLNYLSFFAVQSVIKNTNTGFNYRSIVGNVALKNAFRYYKWGFNNIINLQILNIEDIKRAARTAKKFDPHEITAIKKHVEEQLAQPTNIKADELTQQTNLITPTTQIAPTASIAPIAGGNNG